VLPGVQCLEDHIGVQVMPGRDEDRIDRDRKGPDTPSWK
jgi:hypothetical protein